MKALGPIPPGFEADAQDRLLIGGWDAEMLVGEAGGTPLFVYDTRMIAYLKDHPERRVHPHA